jgi:hypothetical protein
MAINHERGNKGAKRGRQGGETGATRGREWRVGGPSGDLQKERGGHRLNRRGPQGLGWLTETVLLERVSRMTTSLPQGRSWLSGLRDHPRQEMVGGNEGVTRTLNLCSSGRFGDRGTTLSRRWSLLRSLRPPPC